MSTIEWLQLGLLMLGVGIIYFTFRNRHPSGKSDYKPDVPVVKFPKSERLWTPEDSKKDE